MLYLLGLLGCGVGPVPFRIDFVKSRGSWEMSWGSSEILWGPTVEPHGLQSLALTPLECEYIELFILYR